MHLKGGENMSRGDVEFAGLRGVVTQVCQLRLEPADARQFAAVEQRLLTRHRLFIRPDAESFSGKAFPGEQRSRIEFAQGAISL